MHNQRIAEKHLDPCEVAACKFAREQVCCFGFRHEGCIQFNPPMGHILTRLASVETDLVQAMFDQNLYAGAKTCLEREPIRFPHLDNMFEPAANNIGKILKKVYGFVFAGHEYTYQDRSGDHGSCPHCEHPGGHERIGYYGSGRGRIVCFECASCFKKFYFHADQGVV